MANPFGAPLGGAPQGPMNQMQGMQQAAQQAGGLPMIPPRMPLAPNSQQIRPENMRMQAMRNMQRMRGPKG